MAAGGIVKYGISGPLFVEGVTPPAVPAEFRGVWIATVGNIDWPSKPGLPVGEMKSELTRLISSARATGFNAIIFQVRPACEVLYPSSLEPWSEVLTGTCGRAPDDGFDPLAFAIRETHRLGMEFHAWLNPFRARHHTAKSEPPAEHISVTRPDWVQEYGSYLWLDPGVQGAQDHTLAVIREICQRYQVDGIHLDDYFYPYPQKRKDGRELEFPDWKTFEKYRDNGGELNHGDWRRSCIDRFVFNLYQNVRNEFPAIKVGISPFGIWRPGYPEGIQGKDSFETLHADSRKWLNLGWLDYCAPQLYWKLSSKGQPYEPLQHWWAKENLKQRHLYPGLNLSNAGLGKWDMSEINLQIQSTRNNRNVHGNIHFSAKYLLADAEEMVGWNLRRGLYSGQALVPVMPWLNGSKSPPKPPRASVRTGEKEGKPGWIVRWQPESKFEFIRNWLIQSRAGGSWDYSIMSPGANAVFIPMDHRANLDMVSIRQVDRQNRPSPAVSFQLSP